jgi:hypothetical protein
LAKKQTLVERFGTLPAGMSKADVEVVLQFLYGAFDRRTAKQVRILLPYLETGEDESLPELIVFDFCRWLHEAVA